METKALNGLRRVPVNDASASFAKTFVGFLKAVAATRSESLATRSYGRELLEKSYGSSYVTKTAMEEMSGPLGGWLAPVELSTVLLRSLAEKGFIYPRALVTGMNSKVMLLPTINTQQTAVLGESPFQGGMAFTWAAAEGTQLSEDEPTFGNLTLVAQDLTGDIAVSNQMLSDAGPETENLLVQLFARGASWQAEYGFLRGQGTDASQPLGMLPSPTCVQVARAVASQVAASDIASMAAAMIPEGWRNAVWACSPSVLAQIVKLTTFQVSQGGVGGEGGAAGYLVARPLFITEKLPVLGTTGDLMFFDPSMYAIGNRQEVVVDASPHVRFANNQTVFRVWLRIAGQPWLPRPVTLADGSTASSIVALKA